MEKILITTIQVNFVLIPGEAGMRQTQIHLKCWYLKSNLCHQPTAAPFDFTTFFSF